MGLQQIQHVLRNAGTESSVLTDSLPEFEQKLCRVLVHKEQIDFIDKDEGLLPFLPVLCNAVQDGIQYDQHADGPELLAQFQDVVTDQAVVGIHVCLLGEGVERSSRKEFQFQRQRLGFWLRLLQKLFPEILQRWRCSLIVALLIEPVHVLRTTVNNGLLAFCELVTRNDLLTKALQELRLLDDRICLAVFPVHIYAEHRV